MTPQQRLKEIEEELKEYEPSAQDCEWLISRVRALEATLGVIKLGKTMEDVDKPRIMVVNQ